MTEPAQLDPEVIEMLLEDLPMQHQLFRQAVDQGDCEIARQQVHSIAGAAAFCQFTALADAARAIELHLHKENSIPPDRLTHNLDESLRHVVDLLATKGQSKGE